MGARIEPETDQDHPDGPDGFSPLASVPFLEVPNPLDAVLAGPLGRKGSDFRVREGLQAGAVVQYLGDGGPRELLALELEDHESAVLVDVEKVDEAGLDWDLAAEQREAVIGMSGSRPGWLLLLGRPVATMMLHQGDSE